MRTFLVKTEPSTYSYADLAREKRTVWSGVTNPQALAFIRTMAKGDHALIYHTGDEKQIVGLARITSDPYEDPDHPGTTPEGAPKFAVVDLVPVKPVPKPLTLAAIKADARFKDFLLVKNSRLSVIPLAADHDRAIRSLLGLDRK